MKPDELDAVEARRDVSDIPALAEAVRRARLLAESARAQAEYFLAGRLAAEARLANQLRRSALLGRPPPRPPPTSVPSDGSGPRTPVARWTLPPPDPKYRSYMPAGRDPPDTLIGLLFAAGLAAIAGVAIWQAIS